MKKPLLPIHFLFILVLLCHTSACHAEDSPCLVVYSQVPGASPSEHYELSVRPLKDRKGWQSAFAWITSCRETEGDRYFKQLKGWSNTYINFEMDEAVVVAVRRCDGRPIQFAVPRPAHKVAACEVRDGVAYLKLLEPGLIAVDLDGQMEGQHTGLGYKGPAIHTVTIFANPLLQDRPDPEADNVYAVEPGAAVPDDGPWDTLYFLPGVHDLGLSFRLRPGRNYYLPGDAMVYGTMNNAKVWEDGKNIRIFGYGTLSGARTPHPYSIPDRAIEAYHYTPIYLFGAANCSVEGITIADSAYHSLMLPGGNKPEEGAQMRWIKIFTWRANGDGINPFTHGLVEDCFIRTQDDSIYVNGRGIRRTVFWNDQNGSTFVLSAMPNRELIVEDCDVIYARAGWHHWSGGRLFNMRGEGGGNCGAGVVFRNIRVSDPLPTLQHFMIAMEGLPPYADSQKRRREPGHLSGVLFKDIHIAAPSVLGEPDVLWGSPQARITDLTFDNVTIGGRPIRSIEHFKHNEFVEGLKFPVH